MIKRRLNYLQTSEIDDTWTAERQVNLHSFLYFAVIQATNFLAFNTMIKKNIEKLF